VPTDPRDLRSDAPLLDAWLTFQEREGHPFTIPGHKHRRDLVGDVIGGDVPLYAGLDSMKLTAGTLDAAQAAAARLWGAEAAYFSVGGSTHGNQALALAVGRPGQPILVARNAHRSMVSALMLAGLDPVWLLPEVDPDTGLPRGISPAQVASALARHPDAAAVHLTDPSYVGTLGDIAGCAEVAHAAGVPLLVDAAWAAHFGFHPDLPRHALEAGADAVVTSAHKTLPAWSQAALVLIRGDVDDGDPTPGAASPCCRLDPARVAAAIDATHTTSPAGAILASIDAARALLARDGEALLGDCLTAVSRLRARLRGMPGLRVLDGPDVDPLKVTLVLPGTGADGNAVEADLIAAGMPVEMADRDTLVAMVTLADAAADLDHLGDLLVATIERHRGAPRAVATPAAYAVVPEPAMSPRDAYFAPREPVPIEHALGRIGAELIAPYPPGIPVLAPGERITRSVVDALAAAREAGVRIAYAADPTLATLLAVSEPPPTRTK
jgi:arginine decarboxylase